MPRATPVIRCAAVLPIYAISSSGDRAVLETLYATGLRRQELIDLTLSSLDLARGVVLVRHGKGRKDRVVPLSRRAMG